MLIISCVLLVVATVAYTLGELQAHGKLKWMYERDQYSFWGDRSYERKYAQPKVLGTSWYYRVAEVRWKEKFPLSSTLLVGLTDGYHFCQLIHLAAISGAVALLTPDPILWFFAIRIGIGVLFSVTYKVFGI